MFARYAAVDICIEALQWQNGSHEKGPGHHTTQARCLIEGLKYLVCRPVEPAQGPGTGQDSVLSVYLGGSYSTVCADERNIF